MKFLLLTLLLFAFHSVSAGEPQYHYQIDKEFTDLVHEYEQRTKKRFHSDAIFGKTKDAGHCEVVHSDKGISYNRTITINKKEWETFDSCNQRMLFFHEVGHCLMNYDHTEGVFTIMDRITNVPAGTTDYECEEYIDELFTKNFNAPLWLMGAQNK